MLQDRRNLSYGQSEGLRTNTRVADLISSPRQASLPQHVVNQDQNSKAFGTNDDSDHNSTIQHRTKPTSHGTLSQQPNICCCNLGNRLTIVVVVYFNKTPGAYCGLALQLYTATTDEVQ